MEKTNEEIQGKVAQNRELMQKLTKKNNQFVFDMTKQLSAKKVTEEQKALVINDILNELVVAQKKGITAKQLYGTPTHAVESIMTKPEPEPEMTFWKIMLDNFLMLFAILALMTSIVSLFSQNGTSGQGIISVILGGISGAFSFYLIYRYIFIYDLPDSDKTKKPGAFKTGIIMALCFIPWFLIFGLSNFLPATINPILNPILMIILAGLSFGLRYLLKKKYNFQGTFFMRR